MRALTLVSLALLARGVAQDAVDYQRDIRPILADKCYACHGPDAATREAGLRLDDRAIATGLLDSGQRAITPGDTGSSELVRRIFATDADERMPPADAGRDLTDAERAKLKDWIDAGAPFSQHWSFVPPVRAALPAVRDAAWCKNAIDHFVLAPLEAAGRGPAREAGRERLIRRVTFDLTGLPPTLAEIDAFVRDARPDAYERVVDRLLASPRFGEHRARYWLDAARYGDTHGFHLDNYRSIWPWRDWVIAAFNGGKPFDEFTIEQLAGDLLPDATLEQRIATGFNRCNPTTAEGGLIEAEYLVHYAADRVETTSTVWLGLTVGCARCHDHKFDPISQRDFYGLFAFFNSIDEEGTDRNSAVPRPVIAAPSPEQVAQRDALSASARAVEIRMQAPMPAVDARQLQWETEQAARTRELWTVAQPTSALSRGGATMTIVDDDAVLATGVSPAHDVYEIALRTDLRDIAAIRLEALTHTEAPGGGVGRASHNNIVLTDVTITAAAARDPLVAQPIAIARTSADYSQRLYPVQNAIDDDPRSGWAIDKGDDDRTAVFAPAAPFGFDGGTLIQLRLAFGSAHPEHTIGKLRVSVSADKTTAPSSLQPWHLAALLPAKDAGAAAKQTLSDAEGAALQWTARPQLTDGEVHLLPGGIGTTFLRRAIDAPGQRQMQIALGSDDGIKVWLNGDLVFENAARRPVQPDQDRTTLDLRAGSNELVLGVSNVGGGHGFFFRMVGEDVLGLPTAIARILAVPADDRSAADRAAIREHFRRRESPEWRTLDDERLGIAAELAALDKAIPRTLIMRERTEPRPAHVLDRGKYDQPRERVTAGVPTALPLLPAGAVVDRLALARWLVHPDHPLTARVAVNRYWQTLFGRGIVATVDDFGSQGAWPTHPQLLDWLAREFVDGGWDIKHMFRLMVTSATYRQTAMASPAAIRADPDNASLARGPRFRLDAEAIRDQALAVSGLLNGEIGGPSVKPYQPPGLWRTVAYPSSDTSRFVQDKGAKIYRRGLYTFWKRTSPNPTLMMLDAPTRESCTVDRTRTNTPLQALALLNDVQFVEAARAFAVRIVRDGGATTAARATFAFRCVTARLPDAGELEILTRAFAAQRDEYAGDEAAARALIAHGDSAPPADLDPRELAAWTAFANMLLNLDETLTKG